MGGVISIQITLTFNKTPCVKNTSALYIDFSAGAHIYHTDRSDRESARVMTGITGLNLRTDSDSTAHIDCHTIHQRQRAISLNRKRGVSNLLRLGDLSGLIRILIRNDQSDATRDIVSTRKHNTISSNKDVLVTAKFACFAERVG